MVSAYFFSIDWANNGNYTGVGDDVTARVLEDVSVTYGRDQARALSPIATGSAGFELLNTSRDYSPENTSSPINGFVLPARPVQIQVANTLLFTNTDFETNTTGWTPFGTSTIAKSSTYSHSGTYSGKLTSDAGSDPRAEATLIAATPATSYQYYGWLYTPVSLGATQVSIGINWFNSSQVYLSTSQTSSAITAGTWLNISATVAAPASTAYASIRFGLSGTPGAGKIVYGDDLKLSTVPTTIFQGHLDEFNVLPAIGDRKVTVTALDALAKLKEAKASTDLYPAVRTGAAIGAILDSIGWSGGARDLDTGGTTLRWWVVDNQDAWSAIEEIVAAEGSPALISVDSSGNIVFRDRHHRLTRAASTASQATLSDTGSEPLFSAPLAYDQGWRDVVNDVSFSVDERSPASDLSVVWSSDASYSIASGATLTIIATGSDPFYGAINPVNGTDFQTRAGSAAVTLSRSQGKSTTISIVATGTTLIDTLQIRGYTVPVARTIQVTATDATSVTAYGQRSGPDNAGSACVEDAQAIANLAVAYRSTRLPIVTLDVVGQGADTRLTQCLTRDLSDRITIVDAETGLNRAFYIEQITHKMTSAGLKLITSFGCEAISTNASLDSPTTVFIFDHATQGKFGTGKFGT